MTTFPDIALPWNMRRILRVDLDCQLRADLKIERIFSSGHIQHVYEIPWTVIKESDREILEDFFVSCRGRYLNDIAFVDPWDSVSYTCRLDEDMLSLDSPLKYWTGSIRLVEISSWKALKSPVEEFPAIVPFQPLMNRQRSYRTVIEAAADGSEKRYEDFANADGIQRWSVGGDALVDAQVQALLDCWEGNCGPYREFDFTDPVSEDEYTAHFAENSITHTLICPGVHSIRSVIEELK